jgi:hypothetical protein
VSVFTLGNVRTLPREFGGEKAGIGNGTCREASIWVVVDTTKPVKNREYSNQSRLLGEKQFARKMIHDAQTASHNKLTMATTSRLFIVNNLAITATVDYLPYYPNRA